MTNLKCSVVIPTFNRRMYLERALQAMQNQNYPESDFEIIVALDGSTDDSNEMLLDWIQNKRIQNLTVLKLPNRGPATARNEGAAAAQSSVLVFVDDDVVPEPFFLQSHLKHHAQDLPIAVLGDYPLLKQNNPSLCYLNAWIWWTELFHQRGKPGHPFGMRDFVTGNVSLRKEDFFRVGGFDTQFRYAGREDYDLGYRLLRGGVKFIVEKEAKATHHHFGRGTVLGAVKGSYKDGKSDVLLGSKHPELASTLAQLRISEPHANSLRKLSTSEPKSLRLRLYRRLTRFYLQLLEWLRFPLKWREQYHNLLYVSYWHGVAQWRKFRDEPSNFYAENRQWHFIDISDGLPSDLPDLSPDIPATVEFFLHGASLGAIKVGPPMNDPPHTYLTEQIIHQLIGHKAFQLLAEEHLEKLGISEKKSIPSPSLSGFDPNL